MQIFLTALLAVILLAAPGVADAQDSNTLVDSQATTGVGVAKGGDATAISDNFNAVSGTNTSTQSVGVTMAPAQTVNIIGIPNVPQLPPAAAAGQNNYSQPYRPDRFLNGPVFLPREMSAEEADRCADSKLSWYDGASRPAAVSIRIFYTFRQEAPDVPMDMKSYVGTGMARASDAPFIAALCRAAKRAMEEGASAAVVDFIIRPRNEMSGIGFGTSGGATGLPGAGIHPYALAGALGFGTGWSNQRVEGEVMIQLSAFAAPATAPVKKTDSPAEPAKSTGQPVAMIFGSDR